MTKDESILSLVLLECIQTKNNKERVTVAEHLRSIHHATMNYQLLVIDMYKNLNQETAVYIFIIINICKYVCF